MKKRTIKITISAFVFIIALFIDNYWAKLSLFVISYLIIGFSVLYRAFKNICHGQIFDENFLMSIASIGAFVIGEYAEAVAVMLFYQIGELFEKYAVNRSRKSISDLMDIRPDYANLVRDGEIITSAPFNVNVGDQIVCKPGEKIPLDGIIVDGSASIDTKALTGESILKDVTIGDSVLSGCININGLLKIKVTKPFNESTASKIIELVENASNKKSHSEAFITKFAKYYTPVVVILALLIAIIPSLLFRENVYSYIYRALSFLVVSCPCALVISVPLSFFGGIGGASKSGILIKGGNYLEALSKCKYVVFDKTGTLTKGLFNVSEIKTYTDDDVLMYAAHLEAFSNHPIAISIKNAYKKEIDESIIENLKEIPGYGISGIISGHSVNIGNKKLMDSLNITVDDKLDGTVIYVSVDNRKSGYIVIDDEIKDGTIDAIKSLNKMGIKTVMLTGDNYQVAKKISEKANINVFYASLLPQEKVSKVEEILNSKNSNETLAFVGDGINDAPVIARADVGIAMGNVGSDAAIEASDVVIMNDDLSKIIDSINISSKTIKIAHQNIVFAILVKIIIMILVALNVCNMWFAVFGDVGVSVLAILNSFRALNVKEVRQ